MDSVKPVRPDNFFLPQACAFLRLSTPAQPIGETVDRTSSPINQQVQKITLQVDLFQSKLYDGDALAMIKGAAGSKRKSCAPATCPKTMKLVEPINSILRHKGCEVWSVSPDSLVYEAIEIMSDKGVGALLVLSEGKLLGIISERDYARKVILKGKSSKQTPVSEIMTSTVISAAPHQTVDECMTLMTNNRIRHLPVVDGDRLVGMVSIGDLVKWIISAQDETIHHLENYITGKYPG